MLRKIATITGLILASSLSAPACDMVPGPEVRLDTKEKAPGWMVWAFTEKAQADGHMITRHVRRRSFPDPAHERRFLETEIGAAASGLYGNHATSTRLDAPSVPVTRDAQRFPVDARSFALTLDFAGRPLAATGFMRQNPRRKDIALIVALTSPQQSARAAEIARNTMEHPGFDCTAGDSP